jgi:putative transposase
MVSDDQPEPMAPLIIGRPDQKGSTGRDNRMFVQSLLWIVRPARRGGLPEPFGEWTSTPSTTWSNAASAAPFRPG